ncbi:MAG: hypothetical protein JXA52_05805 [Planctomycetes bacterium]|nr:hypothetical protein [Planctomycetota bacterium]
MAKKKTASSKKKAAKKSSKAVKRKAPAKKKAVKKSAAKKKAVKKAKKTKKAVKKIKKAAKKAVKKTKKAAKKSSKATSKKKTVTKKKAEKEAKPKKIKVSVNFAPKRSARKAPPGVLVDKSLQSQPLPEAAVAQVEHKLSAKDLREIKDKLIAKRETILMELRHQMKDSLARNSEQKADTLDRAADVLDGNVSFEVALAGHQELEEIETALQKIADHTYGRCESCEGFISSSRLTVLPSATLCASCRKLKEINGSSTDVDTIWGFPSDSDK